MHWTIHKMTTIIIIWNINGFNNVETNRTIQGTIATMIFTIAQWSNNEHYNRTMDNIYCSHCSHCDSGNSQMWAGTEMCRYRECAVSDGHDPKAIGALHRSTILLLRSGEIWSRVLIRYHPRYMNTSDTSMSLESLAVHALSGSDPSGRSAYFAQGIYESLPSQLRCLEKGGESGDTTIQSTMTSKSNDRTPLSPCQLGK